MSHVVDDTGDALHINYFRRYMGGGGGGGSSIAAKNVDRPANNIILIQLFISSLNTFNICILTQVNV